MTEVHLFLCGDVMLGRGIDQNPRRPTMEMIQGADWRTGSNRSYRGGSEAAAFAEIAEKIGRNANQALEQASRTCRMPRTAAVELAELRVRQAMGCRRCG